MIHRLARRRSAVPIRRGQALVELALVLPLLALLLVMAIDMGRVFFGYVALQNASRIGANHAAGWADAWVGTPDPFEEDYRNQYETVILNDLTALNCDPDPDGDGDSVPDPVFTNPDGSMTGDVHEPGDHVAVQLTCEFALITPLAESIVGGRVTLNAESVFAINGARAALPAAPPAPDPPDPPPGACVAPSAAFTTNPAAASNGRVDGNGSLTVAFADTSSTDASCPIESWTWDFDNGPPTADAVTANTSNNFTHPGSGGPVNYDVTLTVTNSGGSDTATIRVRMSK